MLRKKSAFFLFESLGELLSLFLAICTVIWPNWIELLFGVEPDCGDGLLEWRRSYDSFEVR